MERTEEKMISELNVNLKFVGTYQLTLVIIKYKKNDQFSS